jgi:hypothetical protein
LSPGRTDCRCFDDRDRRADRIGGPGCWSRRLTGAKTPPTIAPTSPDVTPHPPGATAKVDPHAEWIEVTYVGPGHVIIYGYTHEPYLRITPAGVEENELSPATYHNRSMFADLPTGPGAQPDGVPSWHLLAATNTARWHDHRIHWMGQTRPPGVAADPSRPHMVGAWSCTPPSTTPHSTFTAY